ncbi:MAG: VWA domain-containing protein [Clostridium sp.]|uniref:vWA domain-containing protein n=1 Tax=Clostridium sp. TaxID=1506 RepID=UPI002A8A4923|nr:VWA domain-containing protein [Clostridium sp.]MDY5098448.1 vWA domain-containing protein [Clostridium sp.]
MKQVRNLKSTLTKRVRPALLAVILLFTMGFSGYSSKANAATSTAVNMKTPSNQTITIDKTAEHYKDDLYKIKFDINGTVPQNEKVKADIIMVVDESTSMNDKIENVRDAAEKFANTIYSSEKTINVDIRMAISTFGKNEYNDDGVDFTADKKTIINSIKDIYARNPWGGEGTNTEAGMNEVQRLLKVSKSTNPTAKRYVLFFTDGLPTYYYDDTSVEGAGNISYDRYFKEAQKKYNEIKGSITNIGGIGYCTCNYSRTKYYDDNSGYYGPYLYNANFPYVTGQGKLTVVKGTDNYPEAKMYSVGLFTNPSDTDENMAKQFLSTIQSVETTQKAWSDKYYTNDKTKIVSMFTSIANEVKTDINEAIIKDGKITDILPSTFTLPQDAADKEIAVKVNGTSVTPSEGFFKVVSSNPETIELDLSKITQTPQDNKVHIEISYNVTLSDSYFSGKDIATNVSATLTGKDPLKPSESIEGTFPVPHVTIEPKVGSITVDKVVKGSSTFDTTFPISIQKVGSDAKYNVDLSAGGRKTMNSYLRGNDSAFYDTAWYETGDKAALSKYGYLTAGTYKVSEIVPMDYSEKPIIKVSYNENPDWSKIDPSDTFTIDKKHSNVYIHVENTVNNNSYWRDRSDVSNTFKYTGK